MNKRILSLVLALVMVLGTFGTAFAAESTPTGNEKVDKLIDLGLVLGYGDGTYGLTQAITRAEVATMVVRALGLDEVAKASAAFPSQFTDMNSANVLWARGYVNVAAGQGIINGYPNGTFVPANNVTYAETAAMLVRAAGGLTEAEEATAVWPTTYLAKAAQLGIFDGVEGIVDYNAPALREKLFEMVYNAVVKLQVGDYHIVKAIVLENYRVEKLDKDEVVVEVIKEVQRAQWVAENRDVEGEQHSLKIPAKLGDVENLLGKVANFTLDRAGNVIAIEIDSTYKVEVITEEDGITARKFGDFTVVIGERYDNDDERLFRTYYNNDAYSYEEFLREFRDNDLDIEIDYAKVTSKNGKVVYIDAFNFEDIAPVKEVNSDGSRVTVYNDLREGTTKRIDIDADDDVLFVEGGNVSVGTREDIKAYDVIHEYDEDGFIVRKDATVSGTYDKVSSNRDNDYFVNVEGKTYEISTLTSRKPVYAYDEDEFYTLEARSAGSSLKEFEDEEVTIAIDLLGKLQYIGSELEMGEFAAMVTRVVGKDLRVLKADGKLYDYEANLDTDVTIGTTTTGHRGLNDLEYGDIVYISANAKVLEEVVLLRENREANFFDVDSITSREIDLDGEAEAYRLLNGTIIYVLVDDEYEVRTIKEVKDAWDDLTTAEKALVEAFVVNGDQADRVFDRPAPITRANEAYVVVINGLEIESDTDTEIVEFRGWANSRETIMIVRPVGGSNEEYELDLPSDHDDVDYLRGGDIIEIELTDEDTPVIKKVTLLIYRSLSGTTHNDNLRTTPRFGGVFEVVDLDRNTLTLRDSSIAGKADLFVINATEVFGGDLGRAEKVSIALDGTGRYLDAVLIRSNSADVTGVFGTFGSDPDTTAQDVIEDIDGLVVSNPATQAEVDAVEDARDAFNGLTAANKEIVINANYADLIAAEAEITAQKVANQTAVDNALAGITTLPFYPGADYAADALEPGLDYPAAVGDVEFRYVEITNIAPSTTGTAVINESGHINITRGNVGYSFKVVLEAAIGEADATEVIETKVFLVEVPTGILPALNDEVVITVE